MTRTVLTASGAAEHGGQLRSQRDAFRKGASATALLSSGLRFACTISERVQRLANGAEVHNPRQLELGPVIQAPSGIASIEFTYRLGVPEVDGWSGDGTPNLVASSGIGLVTRLGVGSGQEAPSRGGTPVGDRDLAAVRIGQLLDQGQSKAGAAPDRERSSSRRTTRSRPAPGRPVAHLARRPRPQTLLRSPSTVSLTSTDVRAYRRALSIRFVNSRPICASSPSTTAGSSQLAPRSTGPLQPKRAVSGQVCGAAWAPASRILAMESMHRAASRIDNASTAEKSPMNPEATPTPTTGMVRPA